jgi:hypothetical protein
MSLLLFLDYFLHFLSFELESFLQRSTVMSICMIIYFFVTFFFLSSCFIFRFLVLVFFFEIHLYWRECEENSNIEISCFDIIYWFKWMFLFTVCTAALISKNCRTILPMFRRNIVEISHKYSIIEVE